MMYVLLTTYEGRSGSQWSAWECGTLEDLRAKRDQERDGSNHSSTKLIDSIIFKVEEAI